ncbi:hypothetical protein ACIA49_09200 [Kribbella sp. NPDC051587]|uniref:hypothetical protein n=1 Tax=Kribbella sp. NPDC051587 TaxID=3364119 RepID=UPI00379B8897
MNLQNLRDELTTRADEAADRQPDLLPGVRHKIRRTKQRRTAGALASVAAVAAIAIAVVPGVVNNSAPDPADNTPPQDYTQNGWTLPGMVNGDRLLKPWIGEPGQNKFSFAWTPTTDKIAVYAKCDGRGTTGPTEVRVKIGDRYVGSSYCDNSGVETEKDTGPLGTFLADSALWLTTPVGKATTVSAEVVEADSGKPVTVTVRAQVGIYSTTDAARIGGPAAPAAGPNDFQQNGLVYRKQVGGDTLLGAGVAGPRSNEVRFKFRPNGSLLSFRPFCTANSGAITGNPPYWIEVTLNGKPATKMTCSGNSTDAATSGGTISGDEQAPAGDEVEAVARLVPMDKNSPPVPTDGYLGLGIYAQGPRRVVGGVKLEERIELGGINYRLATVESAPGPSKRVSIDTPANQNFVLAYGGTGLGRGHFRSEGQVGTLTPSGAGVDSESNGDLGVSKEPFPAAPAEKATMRVAEGKPTGGSLVIAIYLPD